MSLIDPRAALADQSSFVDYLLGIVGLSRAVHALAAGSEHRTAPVREADDFVHALLGVASLGEAIEQLPGPAPAQQESTNATPHQESTARRWLR